MRDGDCGNAALRLDLAGGLVVEQRDAVPEQVRALPRDEEGALADRERRLRSDPDEPGVVANPVAVVGAELGERRPALALGRDVLARVLADRAPRRGDLAELDAARAADG
jgi:hypothetical protein